MWVSSSSVDAGRDASPIQALHGLRETQATVAELALGLLGAGWSVDRHETYDGHLVLLLSQDHEEDGRCFVLHGSADGVHLDAMGAEYEQLGRYESMAGAMQAICGHLVGVAPQAADAKAERQPGCAA